MVATYYHGRRMCKINVNGLNVLAYQNPSKVSFLFVIRLNILFSTISRSTRERHGWPALTPRKILAQHWKLSEKTGQTSVWIRWRIWEREPIVSESGGRVTSAAIVRCMTCWLLSLIRRLPVPNSTPVVRHRELSPM